MDKRVFINSGLKTWSATINTAGNMFSNDKGVAFVRQSGGKWRCVEWFTVPPEIRDRLLKKAG
jgi:hypothetical protein